jgi:hypothetical protein
MVDDSLKNEREAERLKTIDAIKLCMDKEIDPKDPEVVVLAKKWAMLIDELAMGDGSVVEELRGIYDEEINDFRERFGEAIPDGATMDYLRKSLED